MPNPVTDDLVMGYAGWKATADAQFQRAEKLAAELTEANKKIAEGDEERGRLRQRVAELEADKANLTDALTGRGVMIAEQAADLERLASGQGSLVVGRAKPLHVADGVPD